jgi:hypothetical protein
MKEIFILLEYLKIEEKKFGIGLQAFCYQVALSYLNIQKKYTDEFLRSKGNYEIQKLQFKKVVRPIISKHLMKDEVWIKLI